MSLDDKLIKLKELTDQFHKNIKQYKSSKYDEANTRVDFIDKFFMILDWDVTNNQGFSEQYREVIREDKLQIEGKQKAPDYSFRIGKERKFFVEAKKPSVSIKDNIEPAYQIRRYGYTAKLPLSILTDFEEFSIYDTRIKPDKNDKAGTGRIFFCNYEEYEKHFEFIYNTFSKNAILKGSFDKYIEENKNKKGTSEVDKELLKLVENWRTELAKNIALRNPDIDIYNLNNAVQKIIDRIIFLRFAEDKEIEKYENLFKISKDTNVYVKLNQLFLKANDKYNAGLFLPEDWLINLKIDDKVFSSIIKALYYPECPYEFSILPIEILGNIYEQFLGKTIRFKNVKDGHTAVIEEKPEVRKAGGVYYTPQYIVNYIVENTVGEKIKNKSPEEIANLKICDPACGSGSFLVGAYSFLLNYHLDYYSKEKNIKKALKDAKIYQVSEKDYKLTIEEKQKILINNIYGVDIDPQAVEVTKLSLYLKLLENESIESKDYLFSHFDLKLLPSLDKNIKCGNSLIGSDFYKEKDMSLFGNDEMRKVNVFDWEKKFPEIFKNGGFDCVIGNPPYGIIFDEDIKAYLENHYPEFKRNNDLYVSFIIKGFQLLKDNGLFSMITPNTYLKGDYFKNLRSKMNQYQINEIIDFGKELIFEDANVFTAIFNIRKIKEFKKWVLKGSLTTIKGIIENKSDDFNFKNPLILKLENLPKFDEFFLIKDVGYNYWSIGRGKIRGDSIGSRILYSGDKKDKSDIPYIKGSNINRYIITDPSNYLRHSYDKYLKENDIFRFSPDILETSPKIIYRQTSNCLIGAIDYNKYHNDKTVHIIINKQNYNFDLKYVLGIFNSKLLNYFYTNIVEEIGRAFAQVKTVNVKRLPFIVGSEDSQHKIISLVDQMLETQKQFHETKSDNDKKMFKQKINIIDKQIDEMVYKVYNLTDDEIKIIEG